MSVVLAIQKEKRQTALPLYIFQIVTATKTLADNRFLVIGWCTKRSQSFFLFCSHKLFLLIHFDTKIRKILWKKCGFVGTLQIKDMSTQRSFLSMYMYSCYLSLCELKHDYPDILPTYAPIFFIYSSYDLVLSPEHSVPIGHKRAKKLSELLVWIFLFR